jgi:hypothetical protein
MMFSGRKYHRPFFAGTALVGSNQFRLTDPVFPFFMATAVYSLFCAFFLLFSDFFSIGIALPIIHLGSAISLLVFWKYMNWGKARYDVFGAALLLIYAMFKTQAALDGWVYGPRIDQFYRTVPLPEDLTWLFLKSESLNHMGILLLVAIWCRIVGKQIEQLSFLNNYYQVNRHLPALVYAAAIVVELMRRAAGHDFGVLAQISGLTYQFGVVSIFFIASIQRWRHRQVMLALMLAVPMVMLALGTGMKVNMIFPLVPAGLIIWFRFRSTGFKVAAVVLVFILLSFSQLYVHYVRMVSWGPGGSNYTNIQLLEGFEEYLKEVTLSDGMNSMSSRMNMTISRAVTVAIADARGFDPYNIFAPIPGSLIPRFLWPGKPVLQPGAQHTLRIHNINAPPTEAWSATAAGFFTELYLGGGVIGWALGVIIFAVLLARIQLYTLRRMPGFGHLALSFVAFYWALRFEEKHIVYAYTELLFTFVFLLLLIKVASMMQSNKTVVRKLYRTC